MVTGVKAGSSDARTVRVSVPSPCTEQGGPPKPTPMKHSPPVEGPGRWTVSWAESISCCQPPGTRFQLNRVGWPSVPGTRTPGMVKLIL